MNSLGSIGAKPLPTRRHNCYLTSSRPSEGRTAGAGTNVVTGDREAVMVNSVLAFTMLLIVLVVVLRYVK